MCRLYLEAGKILHKNAHGTGPETQLRALLENDKTCIFKKRQCLRALVTIVKNNETQLAKQLLKAESVEKSDVKHKTEKYFTHAVILQDFCNRNFKKRLQKRCPFHDVEHALQEFAFANRKGSGVEKSGENGGDFTNFGLAQNTNDEFSSNFADPASLESGHSGLETIKEFDYLRFVSSSFRTSGYSANIRRASPPSSFEVEVENLDPSTEAISLVENKLCLERKYLSSQESNDCLIRAMKALTPEQFIVDPVLPNLFMFARRSRVKKSPMFKQGLFYSQDRASAMAAHVLGVEEGGVAMDACAAPGSKTSCILDCYLKGTGKLYAVEKDASRFQTLQRLLSRFSNVAFLNEDFTSLDPRSYADVTHILVDPSCSGSGMIGYKSHQADTEPLHQARLMALQKFQAQLLLHALSFPGVQVVVYSTCSIKSEENEQVVQYVLRQTNEWCLETIPKHYSSSRGQEIFTEVAPHCIRFWPAKDFTHGFFICKFVRTESYMSNTIGQKNSI